MGNKLILFEQSNLIVFEQQNIGEKPQKDRITIFAFVYTCCVFETTFLHYQHFSIYPMSD